VQPDGKIVVAAKIFTFTGTTIHHESTQLVLTRYNADGTADSTFGANGRVTGYSSAGINSPGSGFRVALQPDGKIVVLALSADPGYPDVVDRYNPDGSGLVGANLDFGSLPFDGLNPRAGDLAVQADGTLVVAIGGVPTVVYRFNPDVTPDTTFGTGGRATADAGGVNPGVVGVALQPDGKIVVAMSTTNAATGADFELARFLADNVPDVPNEPPPPHLLAAAGAFSHSPEHYTKFVTSAYAQYLKRAPDAPGLAAWVGGMQAGLLSDEQVEAGFLGSAEYLANHGGAGQSWISSMYQDLLGRTPSAAEVSTWLSVLASGVPTSAIALGFTASPEREANRVRANYQTFLGRAPSADEVTLWVNGFLGGMSNEDMVAGFVGSPEYYNNSQKGRGNPAVWISHVYRDVLFRGASLGEINLWLSFLG
jgi:uncharacterized delta-60 repeat protein